MVRIFVNGVPTVAKPIVVNNNVVVNPHQPVLSPIQNGATTATRATTATAGGSKTKMRTTPAPPPPPPYVRRVSERGVMLDKEPWFVYLMKQFGGVCKNEANIKVAREPYQDVDGHNRGDFNDKATKPAKGLWQVEMIIGPFYCELHAKQFRVQWMLDSRGMSPRRDCGIEMVTEWRKCGHLELFCFDKRLVPFPPNNYLIENGLECLTISDDAFDELVGSVQSAQTSLPIQKKQKKQKLQQQQSQSQQPTVLPKQRAPIESTRFV
jgi:hypothetical protein